MDSFKKILHDHLLPLLPPDARSLDLQSLVEVPEDLSLGDLALPCFRLSKLLRRSPMAIAEDLAARLVLPPAFRRVEAVKGYLNVHLDRRTYARSLVQTILELGDRYGASEFGHGAKVIVEFSSPNIAKPFGINHLRSTNLGACLARLLAFTGHHPIRLNHLGDWGTQFGKLISAFRRWGLETELERLPIPHLLSLYVRFHQEAAADASLEDEGRAWFARLEQGDPEATALWQRFRELSLAEFSKIYARLHVSFDEISGESAYGQDMLEVEQALTQAGLLSESQEAHVVDLTDHGLPPALIRKKDGATLYLTRDLAAAISRQRRYEFRRMLYIVGAEQKLHFSQLFTVLRLLGHDWASACEHVDFGLIRFKEGTMSTREGKVIFLEDVLDRAAELARSIIEEHNPELPDKETVAREVGLGAILFFDLHAKRIKDLVFDWTEILSFEGETGPYLQYTHARLTSVLRKAGTLPEQLPDLLELTDDAEFSVLRRLAEFPEQVQRAVEQLEPSIIAKYAIVLAQDFNTLYNLKRFLDAPEPSRTALLALCAAIGQTLRNALSLLGIAAIERM